jgi:hypothetical protein
MVGQTLNQLADAEPQIPVRGRYRRFREMDVVALVSSRRSCETPKDRSSGLDRL